MIATYRYRPQLAIPDGNLLVTPDTVWAVWKPPRHSYVGLTVDQKQALRARVLAGLSTLRDVEFHLLLSPVIHSPDEWLRNLLATMPDPAPGGRGYFTAQAAELVRYRTGDTDLDLLVKIADRRGDQQTRRLLGSLRRAARLDRVGISDDDLDGWRARADEYGYALEDDHVGFRAAEAWEVAELVAHAYHRGVAQPPVPVRQRRYGAGHVRALGEALYGPPDIYWLTQLDPDTGEPVQYVEWLTLTDPPGRPQRWPGSEWLSDDLVSFPTIRSVRGRTVSMRELADKAAKARLRAEDQAENARGTGQRIPPEMRRAGAELERIREHAADNNVHPAVVDMHVRVGVIAPTLQELHRRRAAVINAYRGLDMMVERAGGDQLRLNAEAQPGGRVHRIGGLVADPHDHKAPMETIAGSGAFFTRKVGDGVGPVFGHMRDGTVVHFDPFHGATKAGGDRAIGAIVSGISGYTGKTNTALKVAAETVYRGGVAVVFDPSHSTQRVAAELGGDDPRFGLGDVIYAEFGGSGSGKGRLDPFRLAGDPADPGYVGRALDMAVAALQLLLEPDLTRGFGGRALHTACKRVAQMPVPMLELVPVELRGMMREPLPADQGGDGQQLLHSRDQIEVLDALATAIEQAADYPAGQALFADPTTEPLRIGRGMTIINVRGLRVPKRNKPTVEYDRRDREAATIMYLIAEYMRLVVNDPALLQVPVQIVLDEAWSITATEKGAELISELYRDGRKKYASLWVLSQDPADFPPTLASNAGLRLIGCCETDASASAGLQLLSLEDTEAGRQWLRNLPKHTYVMQTNEVTGQGRRTGVVVCNLMFARMLRAFDTSPTGERVDAEAMTA